MLYRPRLEAGIAGRLKAYEVRNIAALNVETAGNARL
jgi:hypothetical protein